MKSKTQGGFTLIELVMVILLLSILAAIAIPNFIDFRTDAKNATTYGALGAIRSAIAISLASIQVKEDPTVPSPKYPTLLEMEANAFTSSHPNLSNTAILDPTSGVPANPWTVSTALTPYRNSIIDCGTSKPAITAANADASHGWCYKETSGEIWANSNLNGGGTKTENTY